MRSTYDARLDRRPPYTVLAYAAVVATVLVVFLILEGLDRRFVTGGLLLAVATAGLLRGFWPAWLVLSFVAAGDVVIVLVRREAWWWAAVIVNAIMLALLLAPSTRQYASRGRPRARR